MTMYSISDVSEHFHLTVRTIRFYESIGLIHASTRKSGKVRYFCESTITEEIEKILFLKQLNFRLCDIKSLLDAPFYTNQLLINIRLSQVDQRISQLAKEKEELEQKLQKYQWEKLDLRDTNTLLEKNVFKKFAYSEMNKENIQKFVEEYLNWHQERGLQLDKEHLESIIKYNNQSNPLLVNYLNQYLNSIYNSNLLIS